MAIKMDNSGTGATTQQTTMAGAFNQAQSRAQENKNSGFSFRNMSSLSRAPMGRTPASEILMKLHKAMAEVYSEAADSKTFEFTLIPIDMNMTTELSVSVLVLCLRLRDQPDTGVAYHTLIIEGSVDQPVPRYEVINGVNTEIIRTVGEANDATLRQVVANYVGKHFPQSKQLYVDACVVPRDLTLDQQSVYKLAANAMFAASSELEIQQFGFEDLNLLHAERDSNLSVRTTFSNPQITNAVGQPVRSDIEILFSAAPLNQPQQGQQQAVERVSSIAKVSGFMDLVWHPAEVQQTSYLVQQPTSYQRYAARFVITALESTQLLTIGAQLLALIPAFSLRSGDKWVQAFRRSSFSNAIDLHDIGAVGIEVNFENNQNGVGSRIDTKSDSFKPEHFHKLVASTIQRGMILSLDVPECGPDTWYNGVFGAAAAGNPEANNAIINAANQLTGGTFGSYFPPGGRIAMDEQNRIHLGSYVDSTGVRKDIRDIDYLAIMNLVGEKDPQVVRDWSDSFSKSNYPLELRLAGRKRIISAIFNDVNITGYATRVTFTAEFINALMKGCEASGLALRMVDSYADMGSFERATNSFIGASMISNDSSGLFNRSYGAPSQNFGGSRFVNRW